MMSTDTFPSPTIRLADSFHGLAIDRSLQRVKDQLIKDLAKLYQLKAAGQPVEIPQEIVIKDVVVRIS